MKIVAGIVTYNPDLRILKENLLAIIDQADHVVIVDNGSSNIESIKRILYQKEINIISNRTNSGIAKALNQICEYAYSRNYKWLITLDQDSLVPYGMIDEFKKYIDFDRIGIISPRIKDCNERYSTKSSGGYEYIDKCITSASMMNLDVYNEIGEFDEKMFIDLVDFEYCFRLRKNGYKIIRANKCVLIHHLGELKQFKFGKRIINVTNHSPERCYYFARNTVYMYLKYKNEIKRKKVINTLVKKTIKIVFFEEKKYIKMKKMFFGFIDGCSL